MATSYVEYRGRGFWSFDPYLEHLVALLADEIGNVAREPWLGKAQAHWRMQSSGHFAAHMHPNLDALVTTDERREVVLRLLAAVARRVDATPEVQGTAILMARLLRGEITTDAASPLDYMVSGDLDYRWP